MVFALQKLLINFAYKTFILILEVLLDVPLVLKAFLKTIWKQKDLLPKVKTFAWRMLSKALPTGMRAGRFSIHILQNCCRCAQQEDEFHLFFLCDFARAAWFAHPWYFRSDLLTENHLSM